MQRAARLIGSALLILVTAAFLPGAEDPSDWHVTSSPAAVLFSKSAFAHGYIHGYEQGFHAADLDLQMGRDARDPTRRKEFRELAGYHTSFGSKAFFQSGYRAGFRVGYADSYAGRQFRAIAALRNAAAGLAEAPLEPSNTFDEGIASGYDAGRQQGLRDGRAATAFKALDVRCHGSVFHPFRHTDEYCSGYGRGYRIGYADGYFNQAPRRLAQTSK